MAWINRFIASVFATIMFAAQASACTYYWPFSNAQDFVNETPVIFEGIAQGAALDERLSELEWSRLSPHERSQLRGQTLFLVTRIWKGNVDQLVGVHHQDPESEIAIECGFEPFEWGGQYLVLANMSDEGALVSLRGDLSRIHDDPEFLDGHDSYHDLLQQMVVDGVLPEPHRPGSNQ